MSNYTLAVAWSGKDALSDSDAAKVISGSDFNTEFTAVQTAVNTKADTNGSATESFSATTATAGTNTTQVATTAFVTTAIAAIPSSFPIGSIFTTVTAYANSAAVVAVIGGTTWVSFAAGKMLMGVDSTDTDFDTVEETGGAKTHTLTTDEIPSHAHDLITGRNDNGDYHASGSNKGHVGNGFTAAYNAGTSWIGSTGGGAAHSIMNPYITVYMWKRTA
jgi:hypothetical protein